MLVITFPAASATSILLVSAHRLQNSCKNTGSTDAICRFVAGLVDRWGPVVAGSEPCTPGLDCPAECQNPCGAGFDRCYTSTDAVQGIESYLSTNGSAEALSDTMANACLGRFPRGSGAYRARSAVVDRHDEPEDVTTTGRFCLTIARLLPYRVLATTS